MCPEGDGSAPPDRKRFCTHCGRKVPPDCNFCPGCGQALHSAAAQSAQTAPAYYPPYVPPKPFDLRDLGRGFGAWGALALFILTAVNVVILLWGMWLVYPHMEKHTTLFIVAPMLEDGALSFIVPLYDLGGGISFFLYYVALAAAITASFLWMAKKSLRPMADELMSRTPKGGHSPLYVIATVLMAVISFNIMFNLTVMAGGVTPTTPDFESRELWELLFGFAKASVWEEIIVRILLIGIPLLMVDYLIRVRNPEKGMRRLHRYILGGGFAIGRKEAFFLAFSATLFGLAHLSAWDFYKVIPAMVGGLAFGYLFLKLGVYASIMMHFMIDFLSIPTTVFPDNVWLALVIGLMIIVWVIIGVAYVIRYAARGLGWITGKKMWPDSPRDSPKPAAYPGGYRYPPQQQPPQYPQQAPPYPAQQYRWQQPPAAPVPPPAPPQPSRPRDPTAIGYVCPHCGNTEATYKDGQLKCTKCGKN